MQVLAIPYILSLQLPDEATILEDIFTDLRERHEKAASLRDTHTERLNQLIGQILEANYKDKDYSKVWREVTKEESESEESADEAQEKPAEQSEQKSASAKDSRIPDVVGFCLIQGQALSRLDGSSL